MVAGAPAGALERCMSYVGGPFIHDVFVSYSHGDVQGTGSSPLERWSRGFAQQFEEELRNIPRFGETVRLFLDQHHRAGQGVDPLAGLSPQLEREIGASAVLAVLLSPHYLGSKWCAAERDWWHASQPALDLSCDERVALARIWPLEPNQELPALFKDASGEPLPGFWFHDRKTADLRPHPYGYPVPGPATDGPFRDALLELVGRVGLKLDKLKALLGQREREKRDAERLAGSGQVVYLHARENERDRWEATNDELARSGLVVMPGEPERVERDPEKAERKKNERIETLRECDALLLLPSNDGRALDADILTVGRTDRNSARARSNRLLPGAVIDTFGVPPVLTPQRLRAAQMVQVDWIDATRAPLDAAVKTWLGEKGHAGGAVR